MTAPATLAPADTPGAVDPGRAARERAAFDAGLKEREVQVLWGMSYGLTNDGIARELCLGTQTVKTHACRMFRKLGARDRAHAVAIGFRKGMLA